MSDLKSIENAIRPAIEEIRRRKDVMDEAVSPSDPLFDEIEHFTRDADAPDLPFHLPDQHWALVSMGTAVLAPRPVDSTNPSLRVYGTFATREEAREHAEDVRRVDDVCSLIAIRTHEWILMPQTEVSRDDPEENARRLQRRLETDAERRADEDADFRQSVLERRAAEEIAGIVEDEDEAHATAEAERILYKPPKRLRAGAEVRGQSHVALCAIRDPVVGECAIQVLGAFETSSDADAWVRNIASKVIHQHNVHVIAACEWVYPNAERERAAKTKYRNDELQRIMDAADRNHKSVKDYKSWKKEQDAKRAALPELTNKPDMVEEE